MHIFAQVQVAKMLSFLKIKVYHLSQDLVWFSEKLILKNLQDKIDDHCPLLRDSAKNQKILKYL